MVPDDSITIGRVDADQWIVVFTDLECPACHHYVPKLIASASKNSETALVIRNYPLRMHKDAYRAAVMMETMPSQDKAVQYLVACSREEPQSNVAFSKLAESCGMIQGTAEQAIAKRGNPILRIERDKALAKELKVAGTPMFFWVTRNGMIRSIEFRDALTLLGN